ncbi:MAG: putative extracellular ligand-binding protein [Homoserinimonas sp.]|nr:putative extracellular ligand-binding protein [Homoserinimonas sp.]
MRDILVESAESVVSITETRATAARTGEGSVTLRRRFAQVVAVGAVLVLTACNSPAEPLAYGKGPLIVGSLLPHTAYGGAGTALVAAVDLAIADINAAGGVFGEDAQVHHADSADTSDAAAVAIESLAAVKAHVVIGAYTSQMTFTVVDRVTESGAVMLSGSNASAGLTGLNPRFFRTNPTDLLQADMIATTVAVDGHKTAAILGNDDAAGIVFLEGLAAALQNSGVEVVAMPRMDPASTDLAAPVDAVVAAAPEVVILLTDPAQSEPLIQSLVATHGYTADSLFLADSAIAPYALERGILEGLHGFIAGPAPKVAARFNARLMKLDPHIKSFEFAASTYDAVIVAALAAMSAESTKGADIAEKVPDVSGGVPGGTLCDNFSDCADLLVEGKSVDYEGLTGDLAFNLEGDVTSAHFNLYRYAEDGALVVVE